MRVLCWLASAAVVLPSLALADNRPVTVVTDMTHLGREAPQPAPGKPVYYLPYLRGYQEIGQQVAGEKKPDAHALVHIVATELSRQGYFLATQAHPPQILLAISWGCISPSSDSVDQGIGIADFGTDGHAALPDDHLSTLEEALVLGHTALNLAMLETPGHREFMSMIGDPRYFVIVAAFDFKTFQATKQSKLLWTTKMTVKTGGVFFPELVDGMLKAGAASFGKETMDHPKVISIVPEGSVHVGTPTVKE